MGRYILRRLGQSLLTIFGVMLITFLLFRVIAKDISAAQLGEKATEQQRAEWRHRYGYDRPKVINIDKRLMLIDRTAGSVPPAVRDPVGSNVANALGLTLAGKSDFHDLGLPEDNKQGVIIGRYVTWPSDDTPIAKLTEDRPMTDPVAYKAAKAKAAAQAKAQAEAAAAAKTQPATSAPAEPAPAVKASQPPSQPATQAASSPTQPASQAASQPSPEQSAAGGGEEEEPAPKLPLVDYPALYIRLADGTSLLVDLAGVATCGELIDRINNAPGNKGRLEAEISPWRFPQIIQSQFFHHLWDSISFQARSLKGEKKKLTEIIAERAPKSLAVQVPAFALEWMIGMIIACIVAYFRGTLLDKAGVFLSVLGMCIPFLAFMMYGQKFMFDYFPKHAYGIQDRVNVYVPIAIMVLSGLGSQVRFYRTIILDETNRDYVRTARAKGVPLPAILFKHVLRNCMLPILTSLILSIPFLFMGGLLTESYFGIPGLGDLMITSIQDYNEPVMSGMVFLTALIYTVATLLTDISYGLFDPRIRLR